MRKIIVVFGTRPEAIKMSPLVFELNKNKKIETIVCVTGQHQEMLSQVLDSFAIKSDYDLNIMQENQTLFDITTRVLIGMREILQKEKPDLVLVHGDTSTSFAAGLAAFYMHIPVGHVEAGLRTYDISAPYPEEYNRQSVGVLSTLHFAPTETAKNNLLKEGKHKESIFVTGNTVIDALRITVKKDYHHELLDWASDSRMILLTAHRRENIGEPMYNIFSGVLRVLNEFDDIKIIYPVHKNPQVIKIAKDVFGSNDRIRLIDPLDVFDFHNFISRAEIVLTDSGGVQEEAPALGKPVLVLRNVTERPEGISTGGLKLVGTDSDKIAREFRRLLIDKEEYSLMSKAGNPYGDGTASERIVQIICDYFNL